MLSRPRRSTSVVVALVLTAAWPIVSTAAAEEIWVAPTYQADTGGFGTASNVVWPVTQVGAVRLAWGVPNDLDTFQSARVVLIPQAPGGPATLNVFICQAEPGDLAGTCTGPVPHAFTGVPNQLLEVDISAAIAPLVGIAGQTSLAVLAYTTPTTATDRIVGLRFAYAPVAPAPDTIGTSQVINNSLTASDLAPNSVGPSEVAFNYAASASEGGAAADLACAGCVGAAEVGFAFATPGANTFTGTQTINGGNLDLDNPGGKVTRDGALFIHSSGGTRNIFVGGQAGEGAGAGTGMNNTGIGALALQSNTAGSDNTAVGQNTLAVTHGNKNTAVGSIALVNTSGSLNTAVGADALWRLSAGSRNTAIGWGAGQYLTSGSDNLYIDDFGGGIGFPNAESGTIRIGSGAHTRIFIRATRGVTTGVANAIPVLIDGAGQLGTASSSRRVKEDIRDMADASRRLLQLRPVTFRYKQAYTDGSKPIQFGLVAEEVAAVFPELAVRGADGQVETVHYEKLSVLLLNELQRQERLMQEILNRLAALEVERSAR